MAAQPPALTEWQAHQRRSKRVRVVDAIKRLDRRGARITFAAVAEEAGVDRSWLYSHEDLAAEIKRLRDETRGPLEPRPQRERASDASLRVRLAAAQQVSDDLRAEIKQLREENRALRDKISRLRGDRWESV
jgi:uncharacterized alpha-E superfamily protein